MKNVENIESNLQGKNAFVTGASRGLGEQIALNLLEHGAYVIGSSRSDPPESIQTYIDQGKADYELGDLAQEGKKIVNDIYEKHHGFEIFINNAGAFSPDYFTHLDTESIRRDIELDLIAPLLLHRSWFELYDKSYPSTRTPQLSVNICSISSFYAWPGGTAYQAAKSGLAAAVYGLRSMQQYLNTQATNDVKHQVGPSADLTTRLVAIYPDNIDTGLLARTAQNSLYKVRGDALPTKAVLDTIALAIEGRGNFSEYDDIAILANPTDPISHEQLHGIYHAFIPIDQETHRPDFFSRKLEKFADESVLVKR